MHKCLACEKEINVGKYCSNKCQQSYQNNNVINAWLNGEIEGSRTGLKLKIPIRNFLLEKSNYRCSSCGWNEINPKTGKSPLEIDHIDGNSANNKPDNLRVLCPNCHSLTDSWKALNKGKGNKERLRYSGLLAQ